MLSDYFSASLISYQPSQQPNKKSLVIYFLKSHPAFFHLNASHSSTNPEPVQPLGALDLSLTPIYDNDDRFSQLARKREPVFWQKFEA